MKILKNENIDEIYFSHVQKKKGSLLQANTNFLGLF